MNNGIRYIVAALGVIGVIIVMVGGIVQARSSATGLSPCPSATATGCDKSKLSVSGGFSGCKGSGTAMITASPIALSDLLYIQPMGLEIGGHVTPIDHGYFYIKGAMAKPAIIAPVYAPLDGIITNVTRTFRNEDSRGYDDYAVTISASCTFRVRFSNMVKFAGNLGKQIGQLNKNESKTPSYTVKAGELIGYTGLPTAYGIDVWVENDESTLAGFVNPAQYANAESWKLHMVDFFDYSKEPLRSKLLAFAMRDAIPRFGKIDYDVDGKLIGNWFKVGTGGYGGTTHGAEGYWKGHLSVVPDGNDPRQIIISFGNYHGQALQFAVIGNKPNPANVGKTTGLVTYELGQIESYSGTTGKLWDHQSYLPHIRTRANTQVRGTVLMQMVGPRSLKMEIFPDKNATQVSGFNSGASMYER